MDHLAQPDRLVKSGACFMVPDHRMKPDKLADDPVLFQPGSVFPEERFRLFPFNQPSAVSVGGGKVIVFTLRNQPCQARALCRVALHHHVDPPGPVPFVLDQQRFPVPVNLESPGISVQPVYIMVPEGAYGRVPLFRLLSPGHLDHAARPSPRPDTFPPYPCPRRYPPGQKPAGLSAAQSEGLPGR